MTWLPETHTRHIEQLRRDRADRLADLQHLDQAGFALAGIAAQLGITENAVYMWCRRHGHGDLYDRIAARQRRRDNQYSSRRTA